MRTAIGASREDLFLTAVLECAGTDDPVRIEFFADHVRWHGRPGGDEERPDVRQDIRSAMVRTLQRWMNTLLDSRQANRHHFAAVSRAMIPDPQFVPGLRQMLERDLTDWARAREEQAKAAHCHPTSRDVTHDHTQGYRSALVALRLLLFTGCRLREILHLRWEYVDVERGCLFLPDSKSGRKTVILNAPALTVLNGLKRIGPYVVPWRRPGAAATRSEAAMECGHQAISGIPMRASAPGAA